MSRKPRWPADRAAPLEPARRPAASARRRRSILIVDDEEAMRWSLTRALEKRGKRGER